MSARYELLQSIDGTHWAVYDRRTGRLFETQDPAQAARVLAWCRSDAPIVPYLRWGGPRG